MMKKLRESETKLFNPEKNTENLYENLYNKRKNITVPGTQWNSPSLRTYLRKHQT